MHIVLHAIAVKITVECRIEQRAGILDGYPIRGAGRAARPPRIQKYATRLVVIHLVAQQLRIYRRLVRHEGTAEARAESCSRLRHSHLGSRQLGGEALHEMVHDLLAVENRKRRQRAEGVCREQHDGFRMTASCADGNVRVAGQRIGKSRVLRNGSIREVQILRIGFLDGFSRQRRHVFDDGALHGECSGDYGLGLFIEIDELGVTTVLKIGNSVFRPTRLVIADEPTIRICGQGRLTGARETEEYRGVVADADVAGTVHRQMSQIREQIVHHRENCLLDQSAIVSAADDQA